MKKRLTNQELRSLEKKKMIYDIAMKMFHEYGYEQTTVRDICNKAGITTSSFYNYFGDKDGLILVYLYDVLEKGRKHLELMPDNLDNPYQAICNYFVATSVFMDKFSPDIARQTILLLPKLTNGNYKALPANRAHNTISVFLKESIKYGSIDKDTDTDAISEYLLMSANGITLYWINYASDEHYIDVLKRLLPVVFKAVTDEPVIINTDLLEKS